MEAKRQKAGTCCLCIHRDKEETFWGRSICKLTGNRQHPVCDRDGRKPTFEFDPTVLEAFKDAA